MQRVEEPLQESAQLAWLRAPELCRKDPATGENCSWYHGLWQVLRVMGLGGSPAIHADFYHRALGNIAGGAKPPRVLVSGAADYSIFAHVLAAFGGRSPAPEVTVVDVCETPLWLNRWYAERMSCRIVTSCGDISEFEAAGSFDAVCTHSFLGQIPASKRPALFSAWQRLLRPGGLAITADRVRPASGEAPIRFSPQQAREFCATVLRQGSTMRETLKIDPAELARISEIYASRQALYPVRSRTELHDLFRRSGFDIADSTGGPNEVATQQEDSGPAIPAKAEYALVIARRI